jgi:hypothetical protein
MTPATLEERFTTFTVLVRRIPLESGIKGPMGS